MEELMRGGRGGKREEGEREWGEGKGDGGGGGCIKEEEEVKKKEEEEEE